MSLKVLGCRCSPPPTEQSMCDYCHELPDAFAKAIRLLRELCDRGDRQSHRLWYRANQFLSEWDGYDTEATH